DALLHQHRTIIGRREPNLPIDCIVEWQSRRLCFPPLRRVVIASIDDDRGKPSDLSLADKLVGDRLAGAGGPLEPRARHPPKDDTANEVDAPLDLGRGRRGMWAFRPLPVVAGAVRLRLAAWNTGVLPRPTSGRRRPFGADEPIFANPGDAHGLPDLEC